MTGGQIGEPVTARSELAAATMRRPAAPQSATVVAGPSVSRRAVAASVSE